MKATIELDDDLYRQLKAAAALRGAKVRELVAEGIRQVLRGKNPTPARRIRLPLVKSRRPGTLKLTSQMIAESEAQSDAGRET